MSHTVALGALFLHYDEPVHCNLFKSVLDTVSCCHKYSVEQQMCIHLQLKIVLATYIQILQCPAILGNWLLFKMNLNICDLLLQIYIFSKNQWVKSSFTDRVWKLEIIERQTKKFLVFVLTWDSLTIRKIQNTTSPVLWILYISL